MLRFTWDFHLGHWIPLNFRLTNLQNHDCLPVPECARASSPQIAILLEGRASSGPCQHQLEAAVFLFMGKSRGFLVLPRKYGVLSFFPQSDTMNCWFFLIVADCTLKLVVWAEVPKIGWHPHHFFFVGWDATNYPIEKSGDAPKGPFNKSCGFDQEFESNSSVWLWRSSTNKAPTGWVRISEGQPWTPQD